MGDVEARVKTLRIRGVVVERIGVGEPPQERKFPPTSFRWVLSQRISSDRDQTHRAIGWMLRFFSSKPHGRRRTGEANP